MDRGYTKVFTKTEIIAFWAYISWRLWLYIHKKKRINARENFAPVKAKPSTKNKTSFCTLPPHPLDLTRIINVSVPEMLESVSKNDFQRFHTQRGEVIGSIN
jgi:hypothetical protein